MKRFCSLVIFALISCTPMETLHDADLVFVVNEDSELASSSMEDAISLATGGSGLNVTHVGILEVCGDSAFVIDATPRYGVSRRPLEEFKAECSDVDPVERVMVFRVRSMKGLAGRARASKVISCAKSCIGKAYDFRYMPGDEEFYCSELVQYAFVNRRGESVFESVPMNFKGPDGSYPEFWVKLFDELGMPIPQGVDGTNPHDMMMSDCLEFVCEL